jgi:tryptophan-rich sensory protein
MSDNRWLMFLFFLCLCYGAAVLGSICTSSSVGTWYADLRKPSFNPPDWIFAPVWSALYFLMALSAWLVWRRADWGGAKLALTLFFAQLALNVAWSGLFFGLRRLGTALIEIICLLGTIVATALAFRPVSGLAFWLMVPYAVWVAFAALLNFKIWQLNPGAL